MLVVNIGFEVRRKEAEVARLLRLIGSPMSPYSVKLRSYLRYKEIPFEWVERSLRTRKLFERHATVQLIPLVIFPDDTAMQDTTPLIEHFEAENPEPSIHPSDIASRFLSELLEEFGDEWCNKLMFQYRWGPKPDQKSTGKRLAKLMLAGHPLRLVQPLAAWFLIRRMVPRLAFAGANETNRPHLEASWFRTVELLEEHLSTRTHLFGGRPSFGDFGIFGQFYEAYTDVTCGAHLRSNAPAVVAWIERMVDPRAEGAFEPLDSVLPTLAPLLREQVAERFLAWSVANAWARAEGLPRTRLDFDGARYEQKTFKYHVWSLRQLQQKLEPVRDDPQLARILKDTGCARFLDADLDAPPAPRI